MLSAISTVKRFYAPDTIDDSPRKEDRIYWEAKMPTIGARRRALDLVAGAGGSWYTTNTLMTQATFKGTNLGYMEYEAENGEMAVFIGKIGEVIPDTDVALAPLFTDPSNVDAFLADFDKLPEYIADWIVDVSTSALALWNASDINFTKKPKSK